MNKRPHSRKFMVAHTPACLLAACGWDQACHFHGCGSAIAIHALSRDITTHCTKSMPWQLSKLSRRTIYQPAD